MTLTEFLLARITEDEAAARLVGPTRYYLHDSPRRRGTVETVDGKVLLEVDHRGPFEAGALFAHSSRHQPGRVLAECEAKRHLIAWCGERERIWIGSIADNPESPRPEQFVTGPLRHHEDAVSLRFLALPYVEHPDYDEEWKP